MNYIQTKFYSIYLKIPEKFRSEYRHLAGEVETPLF